MKNFVTYSDAEIRPGPQLNVVLGPNGTGKSTLVCAMVLGLGGKPAVIGRAKEPRDFIKHGESTAIIETELYGGEKSSTNVVVRRKIMSDNQSMWWINGRESHLKDVLSRVRTMNIQVDNLCQFLPQDKVSSFAEMDSRELLKETELAISEEMHSQHMELVKLKASEADATTSYETKKKVMEDLKLANEDLRRDVLRFQERERLMSELKLLESKRPWVAFEASRLVALDMQRVYKELQDALRLAEKTLEPLEADARQKMAATKEGADEEEREKRETRAALTQRSQILERLKSLNEKTLMLENRLDQVEQSEERRRTQLIKLNQNIQELRKKIEIAEQVEDERIASLNHWTEELASLTRQEADILAAGKASAAKQQPLQEKKQKIISRLKEMERDRHSRIMMIERESPSSFLTMKWIKAQQASQNSIFRGKIFGPVILEIKTKTNIESVWLDKAIPFTTLMAFIFEDDKDRDAATEWFGKAHPNLAMPTFYYSPDALSNLSRPFRKSELLALGMDGYLDNCFDGPDLVRWTLCNVLRLHTILYGTDKVKSESHIEELRQAAKEKTEFRRFFTASNFYVMKVSMFDTENVPTSVSPLNMQLKRIRPAFEFGGGGGGDANFDEHSAQREVAEIDAKLKEIVKETQELAEQRGTIKKKMEEAKMEHSKAQHSDIKSLRSRLSEAEKSAKDLDRNVEAERDSIRAMIVESLASRVKPMMELVALTPKLVDSDLQCAELLLRRGFLRSVADRAATAYNEARAQFANQEREMKNAEAAFLEAKEQTRILRDEAKSLASRTPEIEKQWEALPNTLEELDTQIANNRMRIASITPNQSAVDKYEERRVQIEELEQELGNFDETLKRKRAKIKELKDLWLPSVQEVVAEIAKNFSEFYTNIGCNGDVRLAEEGDDFEKYGIDIWVCYRPREDPTMRKLDAKVQSGGERSVATMLYLIALQKLSECPFRLVDEINQGMDADNERMIFDQVTTQASKPNTPQYFLITPKLLPGLKFTPAVTMLCVFNGPFMVDQKDWIVSTEEE